MILPNRSPILKRSIINSGRALPFSPSYNPAIISSLWQNTAKTTPVTIADPVRVMSDLNGSIDAIAPSDAARPLYARSPKSGIRNLLTATEQFDNAYWTKNQTTITANAIAAPDGSTTADLMLETATTNFFRTISPSLTIALSPYTFSIYAKKHTNRRYCYIRIDFVGGTYRNIGFDLDTESVTFAGTGWAGLVEDVGNGWLRLSATATATTTSSGGVSFGISNAEVTSDTLPSYAGSTSEGIYIWGAQLAQASTATPYQRVGTTRADITESGVESAFSLLFDGTDDYLDTGVQSFGSASLFADAGQQWAVCGWYNAVSTTSGTILSKASSATVADRTFTIYTGGGDFRMIVRGNDAAVATSALNMPHAYIVVWNGSVMNVYHDSLTPVVKAVGTAAQEAVNILIGARTPSAPTIFFPGRIGLLPLIDRSLTTAEIASVMRYLASESGAVIT
jgi:hypothetical protein